MSALWINLNTSSTYALSSSSTTSPTAVTSSTAVTLPRFTTSSHALNDEEEEEDYHMFVWIYLSPFILLIGTVGNVLILIVMRRPRLNNTTTSVYLSLMSLADTAALVTRITPEMFNAAELFTFAELSRWTCKTEKFLFYTSSDVAIWILVAFTFDRLIAVCYPLHKRHICVPSHALLASSLILLLAVTKNVHVFWTRDVTSSLAGDVTHLSHIASATNDVTSVNDVTGLIDVTPLNDVTNVISLTDDVTIATPHYHCRPNEPYVFFEEFVRPWIALTIVSVLPLVLIIVSNTMIVRALAQIRSRQSSLTRGASQTSTTTTTTTSMTFAPGRASRFMQTSWMCLSVSLTFLVCVTPSIVLSIGRAYWSRGQGREIYFMARTVSNQLACVNHAVNFFLYCLTGQRFRRELLRVFNMGVSSPRTSARATWNGHSSAPVRPQLSASLLTLRSVRVGEDLRLDGVRTVGGVGRAGARRNMSF